MKQYRINSENILPSSDDDAYLAPDDPIHELKISQSLGGLGSEEKLAAYRNKLKQPVVGSNKGQIQREKNIRPGSDEWFELWFGRNK
jgi:hypothetical protein